ncbi:metallophosphoesterase [Clostridium bowmanii]|uniref:metallophosphoesterase n=1 Tax=Clostridium bowmanii TaxID=132925 RepID=UPI001C0D9ED1|nr:metallophosphoesterase [Clostridium bowmanii]MBU3191055.1 metallophosphoesterase [Clostridium bowmanii]MCA1075511.1 metallophosphoesterase [Clostridium bowmanii]
MRIGVISDTHRHASSIDVLAGKIKTLDVLIHLGDNVDDVAVIKKYYKGRIINVKGNCDFSAGTPNDRLEEICGKKFFLTHGHRYSVKEGIFKLKYKALETGADIVLYGHTHIAKIDYEEGIWYINPGSAAEPRDGAPSFAIIDINGESIDPNLIRF